MVMDEDTIESLRKVAAEKSALAEAIDNVEYSMYGLSKVAGEVKQLLGLRLKPDSIYLLGKAASLFEDLSKVRDEIDREIEAASFAYVYAKTGLNRGDIVEVHYPTGKTFLIRVDTVMCSFGANENVSVYGPRIKKNLSVGASTTMWFPDIGTWRKVKSAESPASSDGK